MHTCKQWDGESLLSHPAPASADELATYKLRLKLCIEETFELFEATLSEEACKPFLKVLETINQEISNLKQESMEIKPVDIFDSLVDQEYVNVGFANLLGLDLKAGFDEVQKSNMTKLDKNGNPIFREDGKLLKSDQYIAPDLETVYHTTSYKFIK